MGWYGDYNTIQDAVDEIWLYSLSKAESKYTLLDKKVTRNTAAILCKEKETGRIVSDLIIFRENMYKPLSWTDRPEFIPATWKKQLEPFMSDYQRESIQRDKQAAKAQREKRSALYSMLEVGAKYNVYGGGELNCVASYVGRRKNTHLFSVNGTLTKFRGFGRGEYWTLEKIG